MPQPDIGWWAREAYTGRVGTIVAIGVDWLLIEIADDYREKWYRPRWCVEPPPHCDTCGALRHSPHLNWCWDSPLTYAHMTDRLDAETGQPLPAGTNAPLPHAA